MKQLLLLIFLIISLLSYSQNLKGMITDSVTNEKLAYANLVIKGKRIGAYSNDEGNYSLDVSKVNAIDTLVVSLIGYHNKKLALNDFINSKKNRVDFQMLPKVESLNEILIFNKTKEYNKHKVRLSTGNRNLTFPYSAPFGSETAILIENPKNKKGKLTELHLKFKSRINEDYKTYRTYYRIAFYSVNDFGCPGALLDFENIIIKPEIDTKNYKMDLEDKSIPLTQKGVFVGIETIKPDDVTIESSMYLTTPNILYTHTKKNIEYSRFHSNDWNKHRRKSVFKKKFYSVPFIKVTVAYEKE